VTIRLKRNLEALSSEHFELLVIGSGIHGAALAYQAAQRGLKTALIDSGDYCSGTSANSLKIVHGGLRYLQTLDFRRMRESINERNAYQRLAPHLVTPLSCVLPTFGYTTKSKYALAGAVILNDLVSIDRNKGIDDAARKLQGSKIVGRRTLRDLMPYIDHDRFSGAAVWQDAQVQNTERFVLAFVKGAVAAGATVANYCSADSLISENGRVIGARVHDTLHGNKFEIRCKSAISCSGPGTNRLLARSGLEAVAPFKPSVAINLIFDTPLPGGFAAGLRNVFERNGNRHSRILFYTPWRGKTIVGTRHLPIESPEDLQGITHGQIDAFLGEIQSTTPDLPLNSDSLCHWHWGIIPMDGIDAKSGEVMLSKYQQISDHSPDGLAGFTSVIGVKYTTGRLAARQALESHCKSNDISLAPRSRSFTPLPGGDTSRAMKAREILQQQIGLPAETERLVRLFGDEVAAISRIVSAEPTSMQQVSADETLMKAVVLHVVHNESAETLSDVVLRRTDIGSAGKPSLATLKGIATIMSEELHWDEARLNSELADVQSHYQIQQ